MHILCTVAMVLQFYNYPELSENFKSSLNISYQHDPKLIAGLIFQVGSVMVDTSIKTKLKKLEEDMVGV